MLIKSIKKPIVANGLLRLGIKDTLGGDVEIDKLTLHDLQETIKKGLKNRLEKSGFPNKEEIVKLMLSELGRNQALLTMMKM